jgi:hypothetical protein
MPNHPSLVRAFGNSLERISGRRIPIAQRTQAAYKKAEMPVMDWRTPGERIIDVSGTKFKFQNLLTKVNPEMISMVASHVIPPFNGSYIDFQVGDNGFGSPFFSIAAYRADPAITETFHSSRPYKNFMANMEFYIFNKENRIYLNMLGSSYFGCGIRMVTSLYNIAKDTGIRKISYYVHPANYDALKFCFYMDYGKPIQKKYCSENLLYWELEVK